MNKSTTDVASMVNEIISFVRRPAQGMEIGDLNVTEVATASGYSHLG